MGNCNLQMRNGISVYFPEYSQEPLDDNFVEKMAISMERRLKRTELWINRNERVIPGRL